MRTNHTTAWILLLLVAGLAPAAAAAAPIDVGDRRQVFIDGRFLATSSNVELVVHPPRKTGEQTLIADQPWEKPWERSIGTNATIHKVGDVYHLWYPAGPGLCYARSNDGIHFEKPKLGLIEFEGSRDNNIVVGGGAGGMDKISTEGMVFIDPKAPESERFRYATRLSDEYKHTVIFSSPDGIHWQLTHKKVLTFTHPEGRQYLDSQNVIFWDDRIGKYVAYMRYNLFKKGFRGRSVVRSESPDFDHFSEVQDSPVILQPDEQDSHIDDRPNVDFYTSEVIKYPWAQDAYYMFPSAYFHYVPGKLAEFPDKTPVNTGPLHTQFGASRDGIKWERYGRRPFVDLGMKGAFDSKSARVFYGLVPSVDGNEMYMYYLGNDDLHGWGRKDSDNSKLITAAGLAPTGQPGAISRLVLRRDGFVSVRAAYTGGEFTTPPMVFSGQRLVLNVDTSATGSMRCELQDEQGKPIPGRTLADADLIHTSNEISRVVSWKRDSDLSALAGKPVRLRIVYRDADLYAFQFRP